ncbi:hypothetical protein SAMN05216257_104214 [Meinhardsimonia xiamenensis]|jgi:hypothetical protein|uniref:Uncharacterized protein n=1 Tax=Meinhardsimonia xiamenensis TaxID=990712 RepID=A0A1G9EA75_9RHOB|nr:hypothetical protein [Meinhardsimonia xiamenensis]PRX33864.1 hypothetical protein LV81_02300 [Meinhardsimonia xiamenensis]SDK72978.1 hypothetical protein SAMN05216257_104214 [Meinhardsimonia xiamenensis]
MTSEQKRELRKLAQLAHALAERSMATLAQAEARHRALAEEIAQLRDQARPGRAPGSREAPISGRWAEEALAAERHRRWCACRIASLTAELETTTNALAKARAEAAHAHGRAEVLKMLVKGGQPGTGR